MDELLFIQKSTLEELGDSIRRKTGGTAKMSTQQMKTAVDNLQTNGIVPTGTIKITTNGTHDVTTYASAQVNVGSNAPTLQEKTVTSSTSQQIVSPDNGYDGLSKVTVNAIATATQATPSISVNSSGLITASATQSAGYVSAGTKSGTKQLTTQAAKTITPSTSNQTAVNSGVYTTGAVTVSAVPTQTKSATPSSSAQTITPDSGKFLSQVSVAAIPSTYVQPSTTKGAATYTPSTADQTIAAGTYCSGAQTIKGDANLTAANIKDGVSIFGILGTFEGSGGGSGEGLPNGIGQLATGTITPASNITSNYSITHNFGTTPDFVVLMLVNDAASSALKSTQLFQFQSNKPFLSSSTLNLTRGLITYQTNAGAASNTIINATDETHFTNTTAVIKALSNQPLKAGYTYQWLCGTWG